MARTKQTARRPVEQPKKFERLPPHRGMQEESTSTSTSTTTTTATMTTKQKLQAMSELELAIKLVAAYRKLDLANQELAALTSKYATEKAYNDDQWQEAQSVINALNDREERGETLSAEDENLRERLIVQYDASIEAMHKVDAEEKAAKEKAQKKAVEARSRITVISPILTAATRRRQKREREAKKAAATVVDLTDDDGTKRKRTTGDTSALEKQLADAKLQLQAALDVHKVTMNNFDKKIRNERMNELKARATKDGAFGVVEDYATRRFGGPEMTETEVAEQEEAQKLFEEAMTQEGEHKRNVEILVSQKAVIEAHEQAQIETLRARVKALEDKLAEGSKMQRTECAMCGAEAELQCVSCKDATYCSQVCQMADWTEHKLSCC